MKGNLDPIARDSPGPEEGVRTLTQMGPGDLFLLRAPETFLSAQIQNGELSPRSDFRETQVQHSSREKGAVGNSLGLLFLPSLLVSFCSWRTASRY